MAGERKSARAEWRGEGLNFKGILGSGYEFSLGSPAGDDAGSPMEFLLAGVAGCTAMDVVNVLRKMRQPFNGLVVEIEGLRSEEHPKVYKEVEIVYVVKGQDVRPDAVEKAIRLSQETYCSASVMFKEAGVSIRTAFRIEADG
jgi:putative redox protein